MSFWDIVWLIFISFAFFAYLMILFQILGDLFRDREASGWAKAIWVVALIFLPLLTALVYLIVRGPGMAERDAKALMDFQAKQDAYIRDVAGQGGGASEEIARAAQLRESGVIDDAEYQKLKAKALA